MPPLLILAGAIMLVSGIRGTQDDLFSIVASEFQATSGKPGFGAAALAVGGSASLGYVPGLRAASDALTALVLFALIAANVRTGNNPFQKISAFAVNTN